MAENLTRYSDNYMAEINRRKSINPNDPTIAELNNLRNQKIASDPSNLMKYAQNPNEIYDIMKKNSAPINPPTNNYAFSDDELRTKAENAINPLYEMQRIATQQKFDKMRKAAENSKAYIDPAYDKYVDRTKESYQDTKNMVNNETLNRGFGRSSYVVDKLTDVSNKETQAIGDIEAERTSKMNEINSTINMYDEQLAESLSQMDIDKATQIASKMDELKRYYDGLKLEQDRFNLDKSGQEFNQNMQNKQFDLQSKNQSFNQDLQTKQYNLQREEFNYNKDMDMKKFTFEQTQAKIDNAYKMGQLSLAQRDQVLAEAKFKADNDPNSLDNQYKKLQIQGLTNEVNANAPANNQQINSYDGLKNIYFTSDKYKNDPQAAYDWLTSPRGEQQNKALLGDSLYKRLVTDVSSRIQKPVDTSNTEKTVMDFVKNENPETALSYILNTTFSNNPQENEQIQLSLINKYNLGKYMK
jgi:hypothetical protein